MDGNIWQKGISVTGGMAAMLSFPSCWKDSGSQWISFHTVKESFNSIFN